MIDRIDRARSTGPGVSPALLRAVVVLVTAPTLASCGSLVRIATWDDEPVPLLVWFDDTECRMALGDSVHSMKREPVTFLEATSETYAILQCANKGGSLSLLARSDADAWVSSLSELGTDKEPEFIGPEYESYSDTINILVTSGRTRDGASLTCGKVELLTDTPLIYIHVGLDRDAVVVRGELRRRCGLLGGLLPW